MGIEALQLALESMAAFPSTEVIKYSFCIEVVHSRHSRSFYIVVFAPTKIKLRF